MQMFAKLCAQPQNMQDYGSSVGDSLPCQESSTQGSREAVCNLKTQRDGVEGHPRSGLHTLKAKHEGITHDVEGRPL